MNDDSVQYVGFWARFLAFIVDSIAVSLLLAVLGLMFYSSMVADEIDMGRLLMEAAIAAAAFLLFWIYRDSTPGKMIVKAVIVDAKTFGKPAVWQYIVRYLGYYISMIPFGLGFVWIGLNRRKQGWHDLLARTVVIREDAGDRDDPEQNAGQ